MASFWIRPEYVVDYRLILDVPVDAAGDRLGYVEPKWRKTDT